MGAEERFAADVGIFVIVQILAERKSDMEEKKLRFEGTASTDTVWAHGDFGTIPSLDS